MVACWGKVRRRGRGRAVVVGVRTCEMEKYGIKGGERRGDGRALVSAGAPIFYQPAVRYSLGRA
jgi:hypothetical protein